MNDNEFDLTTDVTAEPAADAPDGPAAVMELSEAEEREIAERALGKPSNAGEAYDAVLAACRALWRELYVQKDDFDWSDPVVPVRELSCALEPAIDEWASFVAALFA